MIYRKIPDERKAFSHLILWTIIIMMITFIVIASFLKIDIVARASGQVIPSKYVQVIDNLEGGTIQKIYVKAGDLVKKDQILVKMNDIRFGSEYKAGKDKEITLRIKIARLQAQASQKPFYLSDDLRKQAPDVAANEQSLYNAKQQELASLKSRYNLLQKEINLTKPLVKEGVMSTVELLRLERDLEQLVGNISNFNSTVLTDLSDSKDKLDQTVQENKTLQDREARTTIRSPVYGIVKQVLITTEGSVVKGDDPILEIVPLDDTLLIEARVDPSKIGFITPNQKAEVKITAYDFSIYGGLEGYVQNVSADTVKDEKGEVYYRIWVRTYKNYLSLQNQKYVIVPGMLASVDILTGKRTLLHYIIKPFWKVREAALIER